MTRKVTGKAHTFRSIALFIMTLSLLLAMAALAQMTHSSGKSNIGAGTRPESSPLDPGAPFLPAVTYELPGFFAKSVASADINHDGKPDLLVTSLCNNNACNVGIVSVLLGNGDGTLRLVGPYGSDGESAQSVAIGDLNGDGNPDMVVASCRFRNCHVGALTIRTGNGDGTFQGGSYVYDSGGSSAHEVVIADVNADGKPDLLVANCGNGCVTVTGVVGVLLGNGDATFQPAVPYGSGGIGAKSIAVADLNGDSKLDLVVANQCATPANCPGSAESSVAVLFGNGNGTFQAAVAYDSGGTDSRSVRVADVNGDSKVDLVVTNGSGTVGVLLGNGNGSFQAAITYFAGGADNRSIAVADVNQDGKPDLVVTNSNGLALLLGNGDGSFQTAITTTGTGGMGANGVAVPDLNGDGRPDAVVANFCFNSNPNCPHGSAGVLLNNTGPHSPTTTALVSNVNPAAVNQQVIYTATVTNQSGGPIT